MDKILQSVKSGPKVIVLHPGSVVHGNDEMLDLLHNNAEAAHATGLPIIMIASSVDSLPACLQDVEPHE